MKTKQKYKTQPVPYIRSDTFDSKKLVTLKIEKLAFLGAKKILFDYEITLGALLSYFLVLLAENDRNAVSILEKLLKEKASKKFSLIKIPKSTQHQQMTGITSTDKKNIYEFFENDEKITTCENKRFEYDFDEIKDDDK
jgi:hypothetical protein